MTGHIQLPEIISKHFLNINKVVQLRMKLFSLTNLIQKRLIIEHQTVVVVRAATPVIPHLKNS